MKDFGPRLFGLSLIGILMLAPLTFGCTTPTYHHIVITRYDASGNLLWTEEQESITQQDPTTSPMKVRLNHRSKLER